MSDTNRPEIFAESLGDEALEVFRNGGTWEYEPEDVECGDVWAYNCGDKDCKRQWHKHWIMSGFTVTQGKVVHDIHECDEDGNWDWQDSCDIADPVYEKWAADWTSEEQRQEGWNEYAEYVSESGLDPLSNYFVDSHHTEEWTAKLSQDSEGLLFVGAHRRSLAYIDRVAIKVPGELPVPVRDFLGVTDDRRILGIATLDDLHAENYKMSRGDDFAIITFDVKIEDDPEVVKDRTRQAALKHLNTD